jgi:hypothetical protein
MNETIRIILTVVVGAALLGLIVYGLEIAGDTPFGAPMQP